MTDLTATAAVNDIFGELTIADEGVVFKVRRQDPIVLPYWHLEEVQDRGVFRGRQTLLFGLPDGLMKVEPTKKALGRTITDEINQRIDTENASRNIRSRFAGVIVGSKAIKTPDEVTFPLEGARADVEAGGQLNSRPSIGAVVLFGLAGLAARKEIDERSLYLTITGKGHGVALQVDPERVIPARDFAAKLNSITFAAPPPATDATATDPIEEIKRLAELHAAGILTDEEFAAKKAEMLDRI